MMQETLSSPTLDLTTCDREPIHLPGRIQPHGVLLALEEPTLTIRQLSQNSEVHLGVPPEQLLNQPFDGLLAPSECAALRQSLLNSTTGAPNFLSITLVLQGKQRCFDAIIHRHDGLLIVELENPRVSDDDAKPTGSADELYLVLMRRVMARLQAASTLSEACAVLAQEVRAFTDFDRVMVYKFYEDEHGEVIAEALANGQESFLGLHYPASDIPQQARRLYTLNWLRAIVDAHYTPVELVPTLNPLTNAPLDLSYAVLRSVSPVHLQYMHNMGVASSMSISLLHDGQLWGLIACHHRTPKYLPYHTRLTCELLGVVMSVQLVMKEFTEDAVDERHRQQINTRLLHAVAEDGLIEGLTADSQDFLALMEAEGAAILFEDSCQLVGQTPPLAEVKALVSWLQQQPNAGATAAPLFHTDSLPALYPPAQAYKIQAAGLLAITLAKAQGDYILFFRPEVRQTVNWSGNPHKPVEMGGDGAAVLTPRKSFALWQETVDGKALPWKPSQRTLAQELRSALIVFIIERAQQMAQINQELERRNSELDAFAYVASHDLKEPLRGINSYAYYLNENYQDKLDPEAQSRLQGLMRLTKRMDDLLDSLLHFSRVGRTEMQREAVDLNEVLAEALEMINARREETGGAIRIPQKLPIVDCDRIRVREVFTNLLSNGLKYNHKAERWVEVGYQQPTAGPLQFYVRDNGIGIKARYHEQIFQMFKRLHSREEYGGGTGAGLTITKKIIERHGGKIWVESVFGEGATFYFTLQAQ